MNKMLKNIKFWLNQTHIEVEQQMCKNCYKKEET